MPILMLTRLGKSAKYMDVYGCMSGFICTYNQTILAKRISSFRFEVSPGGHEHQRVLLFRYEDGGKANCWQAGKLT